MKTKSYIKTVLFFFGILLQLNYALAQKTESNKKKTESNKKMTKTNSADETYTNMVGLRAGETSGLTYKHFASSSNAAEVIFGIWPYAFRVTGLYEHYAETNTTGLRWYYGAGAHITMGYGRTAYYPYYRDTRYYMYRFNFPGLGMGIDAIIGAEYKIPKIPFALSLDVKPFIEINNAPEIFMAFDPGFGIKYTF